MELRLKISRRKFLQAGATSAAGCSMLLSNAKLFAKTLSLPLGLQLYSVREQLPVDFAGTLKQIGSLGFTEVESAGYFKHSAEQVKQALDAAGLKLVSAHFAHDDLQQRLDEIIAFHQRLGAAYIICSYPGFKDPSRLKKLSAEERGHAFNLEDWRWNADQFNKFGEKIQAAGMKFGYHNHILEFRPTDGVIPYDELMRLTDPSKVTMEMDCGWVVFGGGDPVALLRKYPKRISMLHVKDFKMPPPSAPKGTEPMIKELGQGSIDYRPIFDEAAKTGNIRHCFVEQEAFSVPFMQSLTIDADYMRKLQG